MKEQEKPEKLPEEVIVDRAIKLNPTSELYWKARGYNERPKNWKTLVEANTKTKK
ncbi:MAG TPA: hypothetical protein VNX01_14770 [Bacteroidia bacterium]|jgi:hypothetical protein|nr:hypothetical protein [Bacteroidia bacterium]